MAISRVEIKDYFVFKGEFTVDFCPGINIIIGGNATGKTTLLKLIYATTQHTVPGIYSDSNYGVKGEGTIYDDKGSSAIIKGSFMGGGTIKVASVYIPEKDILEHSKGLLSFIEKKENGFSQIYKDVLINAMDSPTIEKTDVQKAVLKKIYGTISGEVRYDKDDGNFYTLKSNGDRVPFSYEASGFKKLGLLGLLVTSGQLESGTILFWDEPENSLNPELIPVLVGILLELQRGGVQIFIATHSGHFARYFDVNRNSNDEVMFYNLYKDGETIKSNNSAKYTELSPNIIEKADETFFNAVIAKAMRVDGNE
jgi:AAA15 family ATPase/GTPase